MSSDMRPTRAVLLRTKLSRASLLLAVTASTLLLAAILIFATYINMQRNISEKKDDFKVFMKNLEYDISSGNDVTSARATLVFLYVSKYFDGSEEIRLGKDVFSVDTMEWEK